MVVAAAIRHGGGEFSDALRGGDKSGASKRELPSFQDHAGPAQRSNPREIKFLPNTVVEDIYGRQQDTVTGVKLRDVSTNRVWEQDVKRLLSGIGHIPNTKAFRGADRPRPGRLHSLEGWRADQYPRRVPLPATYRIAPIAKAITAAGAALHGGDRAERFLEAEGH